MLQLECTIEKNKKGGRKMGLLAIVYVLIFIVFALALYAVMQIKLAGINVKDFWSFIEANQILDKLYVFAKKYRTLSPQQQVVYLMEAEKRDVDSIMEEAQKHNFMEILNEKIK